MSALCSASVLGVLSFYRQWVPANLGLAWVNGAAPAALGCAWPATDRHPVLPAAFLNTPSSTCLAGNGYGLRLALAKPAVDQIASLFLPVHLVILQVNCRCWHVGGAADADLDSARGSLPGARRAASFFTGPWACMIVALLFAVTAQLSGNPLQSGHT